MPYPTDPPWHAIAERKRKAAERAFERAEQLRREAAELERRTRKADDAGD